MPMLIPKRTLWTCRVVQSKFKRAVLGTEWGNSCSSISQFRCVPPIQMSKEGKTMPDGNEIQTMAGKCHLLAQKRVYNRFCRQVWVNTCGNYKSRQKCLKMRFWDFGQNSHRDRRYNNPQTNPNDKLRQSQTISTNKAQARCSRRWRVQCQWQSQYLLAILALKIWVGKSHDKRDVQTAMVSKCP